MKQSKDLNNSSETAFTAFLQQFNEIAQAYEHLMAEVLDLQHQPLSNTVQAFVGMAKAVDVVLAELLSASPQQPACKNKCWWCCSVHVAASPLEVIAIAEYLKQQKSAEELPAIYERLVKFDDKTRRVGPAHRWDRAPLCPLLKNEQCSIYPARPLACRQLFSLSQNRCKRSYRARQQGTPPPDVPSLAYGSMMFGAILTGIERGLERRGLDGRPVDLIGGLRIALESPGVAARFFDGEKVFQAAYAPQNLEAAQSELSRIQRAYNQAARNSRRHPEHE